MIRLLAIETAVNVCSVCIRDEKEILSIREDFGVNNHSSKLSIFIDDVMKESNTTFGSLDAVAVSSGPGSYTGLRIGISTAKGICYAAGIPLIAVDTLCSMARMIRKEVADSHKSPFFILPLIDARRMEVYTSLFNENSINISPVQALIVNEVFMNSLPENTPIITGGNGAPKCMEIFSENKNIHFVNGNVHSSIGIAEIGLSRFTSGTFEDLAYFEPFYLKDFIPGKPKVKGLE